MERGKEMFLRIVIQFVYYFWNWYFVKSVNWVCCITTKNMILCAVLLLSGLEGKLFCFHFLRSNTPLEFYDILFILFFSLSLEISSFFFSNVKFGVSSYLAERLRTYVRTYVMGVLEIIFGCNLGQKFFFSIEIMFYTSSSSFFLSHTLILLESLMINH